jgi:hypothetical protein
MSPGDRFVCAGCHRSDAKKYAKNLCQTCYKKQKKLLDARSEDLNTKGVIDKAEENSTIRFPHDDSLRISKNSIMDQGDQISSLINREWTGICPDCNR